MITLRLDKNGGINKGDIKAFEHDNLSEVYIIQLYKNGAIYDLTNKSIELTMVERKRKIGDMVSLPIYEATEGKVKLEVVSDITKQDGIYDFKLTVKDTTGLIETFPNFQVGIKNDITDSITGEIIQDPNFTILTEGLKALADYNIYKTNALKVPEIEQDIVEINEQLDTKITQGVGAVMPQDLHTETKKLLTGDKVAVVDLRSVGRENIKKYAITPDETSFLKLNGINLFNHLTVIKGYVGEDGNIVNDENIVTSDYISVKPNTKYKVNTSNNIVCGYFDVNKTLISTFLDQNDITTPSNCRYIRYGILKEDLSIAMLVEGNTLPSNYISYYNYKIELEDNLINGVKKSILKNPIKSNETNFIVADRKNLFDKNNVFYGYVGEDGNIVYDLSVECSDYIEVKPNTKYSLTSNGNWLCGYYDNNKAFISNFNSTNEIYITTPSNCKYIRYTTPTKDTAMIVEGEVLPTSYIHFDDCNVRLKSKWNNKNMAMFGDSIVWYDGQISGQGLVKGYLSNMSDLIKFNSMLNYGHNGGCIAETLSDSFTDVVTVVTQTDFSNIDLAIIEGGTNDFYNNIPLGDIGTVYDSNFDINTFYGAYRKIIEHILSSNPKTQIVLFTPLQRDCQEYNIETVNTAGHKLIDYVNAIKKIGEMYSEPIFDQYNISGVNIKTLNTYTMDGLHLNNYGYECIVKNKLVPFLESI